jgi:hypothetical protein
VEVVEVVSDLEEEACTQSALIDSAKSAMLMLLTPDLHQAMANRKEGCSMIRV